MDWRKLQYQTEKEYATKIMATPKDSLERRRLLAEAYQKVIGEIIEKYNPGGAESHGNTRMILTLTKRLAKPQGKILDLGCGSGELVWQLIKAGFQAAGIDISTDCIARAQTKLQKINCANSVSQADILDYQTDQTFDCLIMDNTIEHLAPDTVDDILKKCYQLLNPQGLILILTPHRWSGPHDISRLFLPLGAKAEGLHLQEYTFTELADQLTQAGFKPLGFPFHPKLLNLIKLIPSPSVSATNKNLRSEKFFQKNPWAKLLRINRGLTRLITAIFFPTVVIGKK
jgi:2-polyprenyl-3-methyl-5-hydroxy-6-metoxy-1,4-benzoquinol methylase